jgi:DNA-directed RNA polymerase II subunit RPB1
LNTKIIHPLFRKEVVQILQSVCNSCGGLLLTRDYIQEKGFFNLEGPERLKAIAEESIKIPCRRNVAETEEGLIPCIINPVYKATKLKETGKIFYTRDEKGRTIDNTRSIDEIEAILDSISKEDAEILGFTNDSHPRRFIMKSILVIPQCSRPPVFSDGIKAQDDLDSMYLDIVRNNLELAKPDLDEADREKKIANLTFSIEHLINNSDKKYKQGKTKVYQSLKDRIQGKEALIRENMMGKRVNYSARTVLGPDPTLRFGQIRVPRDMAPYLTQNEIVSPENLNKMTSLLRAGKITYITKSSGRLQGKRIKVNKKIQDQQTLNLGDEVERWLENGDWVIFNRQPTLHKQGFMGYEVVLGNAMTFGLHLGYTAQHNAD